MSDVIGGGHHHAAWLEMRYDVLDAHGLDPSLAKYLRGRTRDELTATAEALRARIAEESDIDIPPESAYKLK
jgi:hypothetical protein